MESWRGEGEKAAPWEEARESRAPAEVAGKNLRISVLSGDPFPVPFLSPVAMPTLSQPQIKALPNGNTPLGPPTSFQPVRILAVIFNLFILPLLSPLSQSLGTSWEPERQKWLQIPFHDPCQGL